MKKTEILFSRLKSLREREKLSIQDFATKIQVSTGALYKLNTHPSDKELRVKKIIDKVQMAYPDFSLDTEDIEIDNEVEAIINRWEKLKKHEKFDYFIKIKHYEFFIENIKPHLDK